MLVTRWRLELGSWLAAIQYSPSHTCRTPVLYPGQDGRIGRCSAARAVRYLTEKTISFEGQEAW